MKTRFIFYYFLFLIASQHSIAQVINEGPYNLKIAKFNKEKVRGKTFWLIECFLKNNSKTTLSYLSMSCSWTDFYTVSNKELEIGGFECDKNFPTILQVPSGKNRAVVLRLYKSKNFKALTATSIKIGLNIIEASSSKYFDEKMKKKNVIWSNSIALW